MSFENEILHINQTYFNRKIGCIDDTCYTMYRFWLLFIGTEYKVTHGYVCQQIWSVVESTFGENPGNCSDKLESVDYNNDGQMNFREYVSLGYEIFESDSLKASQLNCSTCVGMDNYNI